VRSSGAVPCWAASRRPRDFAAVALALTVWLGLLPSGGEETAHGQAKVPRIGILSWYGANSPPEESIRQALHDQGYVDGTTARLDFRRASGSGDLATALAADLARAPVDVIVVIATPAIQPALNATRTIPIIVLSADPIGVGFATSLARPAGNMTGVSINSVALAGKRLELIREIIPRITRVAFLASSVDPNGARFVEETRIAGERIGVQIQPAFVRSPEGFDEAFSRMLRDRAEALIVQPLFSEHRIRIMELATRHRLPTISDDRSFAEAGGLLAYGASRAEAHQQVAIYVDRIVKGAKPSDLPLVEPARFELTVNLNVAKALGLTIPMSVLLRADHVIRP
jgi:putative ABC transport system substrate-binding protein